MRMKIGYLFAAALTAICVLSVVPEVNVMASDTQEVSDAEYKPEIGSTSWVLVENRVRAVAWPDGIYEIHEYDPATGHEIKRTNGTNNVDTYTTYKYDSNGNMIKSEYYDYEGVLRSTTECEYDENNHKFIERFYSNGESDGYITYSYRPDGVWIGSRYNASGEYIGYVEIEYWDNGKIKREYSTGAEGNSGLQVKNELGETIEFQLIENGSETSHWWYTYENGRRTGYESHVRGQEDIYITYTSTDTENGYLETETKYDSNHNVTEANQILYEYDENGNLVKETHRNEEGYVTLTYTYTYLKQEFDTRGHYIPNFDAYDAPEGCTFQYRLYNPNSGEHFYTGSRRESCNLIYEGWHFEGSGFIHPLIGDPIYRMYDNKGDHLYTMKEDEKALLESQGWSTEGIAFPSSTEEAGGRPMFRLRNPNATTGVHHFTMSPNERDHLIDIGWIDEGIGWYSV